MLQSKIGGTAMPRISVALLGAAIALSALGAAAASLNRGLPFTTVSRGIETLGPARPTVLMNWDRTSVYLDVWAGFYPTGGYEFEVKRVALQQASRTRRQFCIVGEVIDHRGPATQDSTLPFHKIKIRRALVGRAVPARWVLRSVDGTRLGSSRGAKFRRCS